MPATPPAPPVMEKPLCRPGEGGDERKFMLSSNKRKERNQGMTHSTCLLPPQVKALKH